MTNTVESKRELKEDTCWVVTDGKAGMENQALGLAEALGMKVEIKRTCLRPPWKHLTPYLRCGLPYCLSPKGDQLTPPWPRLLIASGRQSILPALFVKKSSLRASTIVYIQDPVIAPKHFDCVIAPQHDQLSGSNVIVTQGALHRVTPTHLENAKAKFVQFELLRSPRIAVMIGGLNRAFQFGPETVRAIALQLKDLQQLYGASILMSPSRRTGEGNIAILQSILDNDQAYIWDGEDDNPYFALLAYADVILVTCDSVSMISEACSTTKPVYLVPLPGGDPKFSRFHQHMVASGRVQWLHNELIFHEMSPINDTTLVAQHIKSLLGSTHG